MRLLNCRMVAGFTAAILATGAFAQMTLTSRQSTVSYSWTHGGGPDVHSGSVSNIYADLLPTDSKVVDFSDATQGQWFGHDWATSVLCHTSSSYAITGSVTNASRITNSQIVQTSTTASGDLGVAAMRANGPGTENIYYFQVTRPVDYRLSGSITGGSSAFTYLELQRFNGFNWDNLFISFAIQGPDIVWNVTGSLVPGSQYRLISQAEVAAGSNESFAKTLNYDFRVFQRAVQMPPPVFGD